MRGGRLAVGGSDRNADKSVRDSPDPGPDRRDTPLRTRRFLAAAYCALLVPWPGEARAQAGCERAAFPIVLDVGHSAQSPGAISARGNTEYAYNLTLAAAIERHLIGRGFSATARMVTGGPKGGLALRSARADAMGAGLFLSVHHDSVQPRYLETWLVEGRPQRYSDRFAGWSLFVSQASPRAGEGLAFARLLADRLLAYGLPFSRHHAEPIPGEGRPFLDPGRGIYRFDGLGVLKNARSPAVLLEAGIIVNRAEEAALASPGRQAQIAQAVGEAADAFCVWRSGAR